MKMVIMMDNIQTTYNKMDNNLSMITKTRDDAVKKVYSLARPRTISAIIQMILSIVFSFGINIVAMGFDFDKLTTWRFWVSTACTLAGVVMIFRATINAVYYRTANRQVVLDAKKAYKELNDKKNLNFKDFLVIYNKKRKIEIYIANINKKIYKLENKQAKTLNSRRIQRYENKLEMLRKLITVEYIAEHIDRTPVKQTLVFYSDFNDLDSPVGSDIVTRANYNREFNKRTYSKIFWYIVSTVLLGVGVWTAPDGNWVSYVVSIVLTAVMVVWRIMSALMQADDIYDTTITKSILDRTDILKQYNAWLLDNPESSEFQKQLEIEKNKIEESYKLKMQKEVEKMQTQIKEIASLTDKNVQPMNN